MFYEFKEDQIMTIDLHNYTVDDAKHELQLFVKSAPKEIREIIVIHGYRNGKALLNMVRKDFRHKRISQKVLSLNPGVTIFVLNKSF